MFMKIKISFFIFFGLVSMSAVLIGGCERKELQANRQKQKSEDSRNTSLATPDLDVGFAKEQDVVSNLTLEETSELLVMEVFEDVDLPELSLSSLVVRLNRLLAEEGEGKLKEIKITLDDVPLELTNAKIQSIQLDHVSLAQILRELTAKTKLRLDVLPGRVHIYID